MALSSDTINGWADTAYAATTQGVAVISLSNPAFPEVKLRVPSPGGARCLPRKRAARATGS